MPSLENLELFAARFHRIGNEDAILAERGLEVDAPEKPTREPAAPPQKRPASLGGIQDEAEVETAAADIAADLDDDIGADFTPDFTHFNDLIEDIDEPAPLDDIERDRGADEAIPEIADDAFPDLSNFEDYNAAPLEEAPREIAPSDVDTGIPEVEDDAVLDLSNFEIEDIAQPVEKEAAGQNDLDDNFPDFDMPDLAEGVSSLEELGEFEDVETLEMAEESLHPTEDSFESFEIPQAAEDLPAIDDFLIPGIDTPRREAPSPAKAPPLRVRMAEINLTDEDYANLTDTLSSYPLNLRLACEEAIAGAAVPTTAVAGLVNHMVKGGSAREAAKLAGKILDRAIHLPSGALKQTGAELAALQSSFGYVFVKKFLPIFGFFYLSRQSSRGRSIWAINLSTNLSARKISTKQA